MVFDKKSYMKEYRNKNRIILSIREKEYRAKNKDKYKSYNKSETHRKSSLLWVWKERGVISDDWDMLHQHWELTSHCEECHVFLEGIRGERKCLDHCHTTGQFRNILCHCCNRGRN